MLIAIVAKHAGANVTVSEVSPYRLDYAKKMGFATINPINDSFDVLKQNVNEGVGFDSVFETSGAPSALKTATKVVKICGVVVMVGVTKEDYPFSTNDVYSKELEIKGVRVHSQYAFQKAVALLESGNLNEDLYEILDKKVYPLAEVKAALDYCINDTNHFKTLIAITEEEID